MKSDGEADFGKRSVADTRAMLTDFAMGTEENMTCLT